MPKATVNYALAATLLASGMDPEEIAPRVGAKNGNTVSVGLCRKGVNAKMARSPDPANRVNMSFTARVANEAGEVLRKDMGDLLQTHISQLKSVKAKPDLKHIARVGMALEPLVRSAKIVHDWGNETTQGIIAFGVVEQLDQAQDAIEVSSSVSDTPSNSVPVIPPDSTTTLDTEQPS